MLYQTGSYGEANKSFSKIYVPLQYNGSYLQYYGKSLYLSEQYAKSQALLEQAGKFNTDDILYCNMGDSYKAIKMFNEAEEAYRHASNVAKEKRNNLRRSQTKTRSTGFQMFAPKTSQEP